MEGMFTQRGKVGISRASAVCFFLVSFLKWVYDDVVYAIKNTVAIKKREVRCQEYL